MTVDLGLSGKRALVTGGNRGIGRAIALALSRQGASVAACYASDATAASELAAGFAANGDGSYVTRADVTDEASLAELLAGVRERFGGLDIVVNNAGVVSHRALGDLDRAEWQRVLDTNLTGMYLVTRAALPLMGAGGSIVNIASAVAMVGMPARAHYTASKAGVLGLTRSLCKELGPRGIRVNAIAPGIVETDQVAGLSDEQRARYAGLAALGRLGEPADVGDTVLFLASDLARFVSGVTINVDGGI
jgi:NAD(P)-dependent dehydrogenase (short-subunit alcohol dehydrogenase family)